MASRRKRNIEELLMEIDSVEEGQSKRLHVDKLELVEASTQPRQEPESAKLELS